MPLIAMDVHQAKPRVNQVTPNHLIVSIVRPTLMPTRRKLFNVRPAAVQEHQHQVLRFVVSATQDNL